MAARETLPVDAAAQRASLTAHQASVHAALRAYRVVERGRQLDESAAVDKAGTLTQEELVGIASKTWTKERQDAARALLGTVAAALVGAQGEPVFRRTFATSSASRRAPHPARRRRSRAAC